MVDLIGDFIGEIASKWVYKIASNFKKRLLRKNRKLKNVT